MVVCEFCMEPAEAAVKVTSSILNIFHTVLRFSSEHEFQNSKENNNML